jgi:hypothetical protein
MHNKLVLLLLFLISDGLAQTSFTLKGQVVDLESKQPLSGTLIKIHNRDFVTFSDENGKFNIRGLPAQTYLLEFILATYPRFFKTISIPTNQNSTIKIYLSHSGFQTDVFEIGGIKVETERDLLPKEYTATHHISSGQIENLQASSLGDVLEMVPGLEKSNRIGLDRAIFADVRGTNDLLGTFGTKILIDEVPFSNNANMQMSAGGTVVSSAGGGIDLRLIPADNIESVEIIRGIPSAKYGDLTSGIIKVKSHTGLMSPRLKVKSNPNTSEMNFGTGFQFLKNIFNVNFNYGFSQRELRKEGDEFHRLCATFITSRKFINEKLPLQWKLFLTRIYDEEKPTDVRERSAYNRGYTINSDVRGKYRPSNLETYDSNLYFHYTRKNTFTSNCIYYIKKGPYFT